MSRWAVVLAGGIGSRFWPLSTPARPKQLLPLVTPRPLLVDSVERLLPVVDASRILILTNASLAPRIAELLRDFPARNIIAEPKPAGTAAALTWAALEIGRRDADEPTMISVHADWAIGDDSAFRETLLAAEAVALRDHALVTVGVKPTRPDVGFGYIEPAPGDAAAGVEVKRFVEKPDRETASAFVAAGYLWNSGIFVWRVSDFLAEVAARAPEVAPALEEPARSDLQQFFSSVRPISIDNGVLERSPRVKVKSADFGWDDIGTWPALLRARELDAHGNSVTGAAHLVDAERNVAHVAEGGVVLYGVSDLVVVQANGVTLVTTAEKAADLKSLVESLPEELRSRS